MDLFAYIAEERRRLADELDELGPDEWDTPSLCTGWSVHVVAAHLNAPWSVSLPAMLVAMVRTLSFDKANDRVALDLATKLDPAACIAGLRANAEHRFTPPGSGPEAPLTDVIVHGADMLHPLGRGAAVAPEALGASLRWLAAGKAKGMAPRDRIAGLTLEPTDLDVDLGGDARAGGAGGTVRGPALALCCVLTGRSALLEQLTGDGVAVLASRL